MIDQAGTFDPLAIGLPGLSARGARRSRRFSIQTKGGLKLACAWRGWTLKRAEALVITHNFFLPSHASNSRPAIRGLLGWRRLSGKLVSTLALTPALSPRRGRNGCRVFRESSRWTGHTGGRMVKECAKEKPSPWGEGWVRESNKTNLSLSGCTLKRRERRAPSLDCPRQNNAFGGHSYLPSVAGEAHSASATVAAGILPAVEPVLPARRKCLHRHQRLVIRQQPGGFTVLPGRQDAALYGRQGCPPLPFEGSARMRPSGRIYGC